MDHRLNIRPQYSLVVEEYVKKSNKQKIRPNMNYSVYSQISWWYSSQADRLFHVLWTFAQGPAHSHEEQIQERQDA